MMRHETHSARMDRLLRTLPPALRGMGFGDPDDAQYEHASDVVAWAVNEIDRLRELLQDSLIEIVCLRAEIDRLREERRWIPVGERLPELEQHVLVFCQHVPGHGGSWVGMHVAYRRADGLWMEPAEPCDVSVVTHWMPLPAPPKGGEGE